MKLNVMIAIGALFFGGASPLAAQDGAALYKTKCAGCHGAKGEGKKAPSLKVTKKDADQITEHLTKGDAASKPPHNKGMSGMKEDQAKAIAAYVTTLK
jgi:mono/diheme cytochrome c family protein